MYRHSWLLCLGTVSLLASDYAFINEETFSEQNQLWHFEADYTKIAGAKVVAPSVYGSRLHYSEGNASMYFTHFLDKENALSWQLGANYVGIDWDENPRFSGEHYPYAIASFNWISHGLQKWRWVISGGVAVDAKTLNFGKSAVYYTMAWSRYQQAKNIGVHVGFFAYYGALNGYVLPILGADFWPTPDLEIRGIFPLDASISYHFTSYFTSSLMATSMGGPYRFPRRASGGFEGFHDGIFKIYSNALEWDIKFSHKQDFLLGGGIGYDFGGWIQISDSHNHKKAYYHFNGAPYARVFAALTF